MRRTARDLRSESRMAVLRAFFTLGTATRQDLSVHTGLSVATVSTLVKEFLAAGVVQVEAVVSSGVGRPLARLRLDPVRGYLVGVDVTESSVEATVFDLSLGPRGVVSETLDADDNPPAHVVERVGLAVRGALSVSSVEVGAVLGVGVSLPGQVQPDRGVSVLAPSWRWRDVPVEGLLARGLGMPVHVDSPLKALTVAELWFGAGREHRDLVVVSLGTTVGAGLAIDGELVRGVSNSAGEWGHTTLVLDGRPCRCGRRGCVEAYVGTEGLRATLAEVRPDHPALRLPGAADFVGALETAAATSDDAALELLDRTTRYLVAGVADLVNLVNPEHVVLTGPTVAALGGRLVPRVRSEIGASVLDSNLAVLSIGTSALASSTVALGMSTLTLELFLAAVGLPSRVGTPTQPG